MIDKKIGASQTHFSRARFKIDSEFSSIVRRRLLKALFLHNLMNSLKNSLCANSDMKEHDEIIDEDINSDLGEKFARSVPIFFSYSAEIFSKIFTKIFQKANKHCKLTSAIFRLLKIYKLG